MADKKQKIDPRLIPLPGGDGTQQLWYARDLLRRDLATGDIKVCPCCGGSAKVYARRLNKPMVDVLRVAAEYVEGITPYNLLRRSKSSGSGDTGKLGHFGLLVEVDHPMGDKTERRWHVTSLGRRWLAGQVTIPHRVVLYQGVKIGMDDSEHLHIRDVVPGFDLQRDVMDFEDVDLA